MKSDRDELEVERLKKSELYPIAVAFVNSNIKDIGDEIRKGVVFESATITSDKPFFYNEDSQ